MKKLTLLLVALFLSFNMSGCLTLIKACTEIQKTSETPPPKLTQRTVSLIQANEYLNTIKLSNAFNSFDKKIGYTYGTDYEKFLFIIDTPSTLIVTVIPEGKEYPEELVVDAQTVDVDTLKIVYTVSRVRLEDFYSYKTSAMVSTIGGSGDRAHVRYEYISKSSECELVSLIYALFEVV